MAGGNVIFFDWLDEDCFSQYRRACALHGAVGSGTSTARTNAGTHKFSLLHSRVRFSLFRGADSYSARSRDPHARSSKHV